MVGVINQNATWTLEAQIQAAKEAALKVKPGIPFLKRVQRHCTYLVQRQQVTPRQFPSTQLIMTTRVSQAEPLPASL